VNKLIILRVDPAQIEKVQPGKENLQPKPAKKDRDQQRTVSRPDPFCEFDKFVMSAGEGCSSSFADYEHRYLFFCTVSSRTRISPVSDSYRIGVNIF
jgi:hypothetical protein